MLVGLKMTLFSEKLLISHRCIRGLMPNLIKNVRRTLTRVNHLVISGKAYWLLKIHSSLQDRRKFVLGNPIILPDLHAFQDSDR